MALFSYLIELPLAVTKSHERAKQRCYYWCLSWCIERLNPEHPCSITSHKLTNLCLTVQTPARIGTGFDILGSSHRAYTTTLHKLAKFCTSLEMLANPCKSLQSIAKPCTTLHVSVLVLTYWAALRQFIGLIARQAAPYVYHCTFCMIINHGFNFAANIIVWLRHL